MQGSKGDCVNNTPNRDSSSRLLSERTCEKNAESHILKKKSVFRALLDGKSDGMVPYP